jgi:hypothetical protein
MTSLKGIDVIRVYIKLGSSKLYIQHCEQAITDQIDNQNLKSRFVIQHYWDDAHVVWKVTPDWRLNSSPFLKVMTVVPDQFRICFKHKFLTFGYDVLGPKIWDIHPFSFRTTHHELRSGFHTQYKDYLGTNDLWIIKPVGGSQGNGIRIVSSSALTRGIQDLSYSSPSKQTRKQRRFAWDNEYIVQRYITNPMVWHGRKFDLRVLMLVTPEGLFVHKFITARICPSAYQNSNFENMQVHLTNLSLRHQEPETRRSTRTNGNNSCNARLLQDLPELRHLQTKVIRFYNEKLHPLFKHMLNKIQSHCTPHRQFQLFGIDVLVDDQEHLWLLEINVNPGMKGAGMAVHADCMARGTFGIIPLPLSNDDVLVQVG